MFLGEKKIYYECKECLVFYEKYLNGIKSAKNTIISYKNRLNVFLDYLATLEEEITLKNIKQYHIVNFFNYLDENSKKILSDNTKLQFLYAIKNFFNFLTDNNDNLLNFDYLFDKFQIRLKKSNKERNSLNDKEIEQLLFFLDKKVKSNNYIDIRNSLMIKLMIFAGLRINEVLNLKLVDFEEENEYFNIILEETKSGVEQTAYISKEKINFEIVFLQNRILQNTNIFCSKKGRKITSAEAYITCSRILKNAKIKKQGCHIFRHTFATMLLKNNENIVTISHLLRHKDVKTTMIYAKPEKDMLLKAVKGI
ncbi:tyrosine-type recombinase/integrase [Campylobacter canadensis]|uniref:tyrosine-type recombinase/integrase n=1 Tax=Campylobacter canadensis TaxID=449520 RepID=UPI001CCA3B15|nr:site-specific integrase [Campylobacter canadensis]MBZ8002366.1 site-specific integrase [Campylobacter canadensis]